MYRSDLFNNPREKTAFEDKYGQPLTVPKTWDDQAKIAEFFNRPKASTPLYGSVERKCPFWGIVNWEHRFVCSADPNMFYFKPDGSANVNNTAGIRAATEHLRSLGWSEPGALSKDWLAQYQLFGAGNGVQGGTFPNVTKLIQPANKTLDKGFGKYLRTDVQPGRMVNGKLVRRTVIFYNISYGVNAFAPKSHHEAAYLFLQWAGGARMYTYLTANPGGYQDPHHTISFNDPLVISEYQPQPIRALKEIIPRSAPRDHDPGRAAVQPGARPGAAEDADEAAVSRAGDEERRAALEPDHEAARNRRSRRRRSRRATRRSRPRAGTDPNAPIK